MTTVTVLATNVQRDCYLIQRWWEKTKVKWSTAYIRLDNKVQTKLLKTPMWISMLYDLFGDKGYRGLTEKQYNRWCMNKHVKRIRELPVKDKLMKDTLDRLLAAAERALGENKRLGDPIVNLSSEDALFLKEYIKLVKEKK